MPNMKRLFSGTPWFDVERYLQEELENEVNVSDEDTLLNTSTEDLCKHFVNKYQINIPILNRDDIVADQEETQVDVRADLSYNITDPSQPFYVPGTRIEITVPFIGDGGVFRYQTSSSLPIPMDVTVAQGHLVFVITGKNLKADKVVKEINTTLDEIEDYLTSLRRSADRLVSQLDSTAHQCIERRKERLLRNRNLVASLGFKLKKRDNSPRTYIAPEVRRKITPKLPSASSVPYKPEPTLDESDYEHILEVIESMTQVMELSPSAFSEMDEETLRSHFLVQLNGHYEGQATGETFNYEGKTDILIRSEGKNIFIAECKYWGGSNTLTAAIDQLLGYSSWRDTKVAVIVFNRNKDFTNVLNSIKSTTKEHPNCKRELDPGSETSFRFIFSHRDDTNREMILTVMAFDVPE
ncbi:hypothetical protein J5I95_21480 [Candidatus Poribacteria bacterium]|nr:hypothetical protein [Candidatus Poribacteria bacterium]